MFTDALKKRLETIPDTTPKAAEAVYWKKPTVQMGAALKMAASFADGAPVADNSEELADAREAADSAHSAAVEMKDAITRLCIETGVDPDQPLGDVVDSVVALVNAAGNGEGEADDDAKSSEETVTAAEVGSVTDVLPGLEDKPAG